MDLNSAFLSFEITSQNSFEMEGEVTASNGVFSGFTTFCTDPFGEGLLEFAKSLQGFPRHVDQVEEFSFGIQYSRWIPLRDTGPDTEDLEAFVGLRFLCIDGFGHTAVRIELYVTPLCWHRRDEYPQKASFEMRFYPAQLDEFVQQLFILVKNKNGVAILKGID